MLWLISSYHATAQTLGQGEATGISLWRVVGALLLCVLVAFLGGLALQWKMTGRIGLSNLQRMGRYRSSRRLRLIETMRLNQHVDLCLVYCDGRELLIAASGEGAQILERKRPSSLDAAAEADGS